MDRNSIVNSTFSCPTLYYDIHVALNHAVLVKKSDSWKSSVIYFMRISNTGVLLVSIGNILCDSICACSNDSHKYA